LQDWNDLFGSIDSSPEEKELGNKHICILDEKRPERPKKHKNISKDITRVLKKIMDITTTKKKRV